jgi:hypothetical protein
VGKETGEKKVGGGEKVRSGGVLKLNRPRCDWRLIPTTGVASYMQIPALGFVAVASQVWRNHKCGWNPRSFFVDGLVCLSLGP